MNGLHLTADLYGCACAQDLLTSEQRLEDLCRGATLGAGLTLVAQKWHTFPDHEGMPGGVTGALLLAESHLAVHTWPERQAVTLDVYVCNFTDDNSAKARQLLNAVQQAFAPAQAALHELHRGEPAAATGGHRLEALNDEAAYGFRFPECVLSRRTAFQQLEIVESPQFGRTMLLDGHYMTSERDEFFYHEAMVHPAAMAHPAPASALVLGGGDGGAAEELLKHPTMRQVTIVDLDPEVVEVARRELRGIHRGALGDPRVRVHVADGADFVAQTTERFDLVLLDLTDPETPAGPLYTAAFFERLRRVLAPGGAMVMHLGAPFFEAGQVAGLVAALRRSFGKVSPYGLYVPLYGAYWGMAVCSDSLAPPDVAVDEIRRRLESRRIGDLNYYNPEVHPALFALPNYYRRIVGAEAAPGSA